MLSSLLFKLLGFYGNWAKRTMNDAKIVGDNKAGSISDTDDFINQIKDMVEEQSKKMYSDQSFLQKQNGLYSEDYSNGNALEEALAKQTGSRLTNAEQQANQFNRNERLMAQEFSHNEAVDARMWQQYVEENKYAWNTQSMQNAGLNPAMMYGPGSLVGTAATGAMGSSHPAASVSPSSSGDIFNLLMSLVRLPMEMKSLSADINLANANAIKSDKEGEAAIITAKANEQNAKTNEENAKTNRRNSEIQERIATVQEMKVQIDAALADSNIKLNEAQVTHLSKQCQMLQKQYEQLDDYLEIAEKNADSQAKQAIASLKQATAAIQNAATQSYLSDYQTSLMYAQELLTWAEGEGKEIINKYLDQEKQQQIANMAKEGVKLDAEGRLIDKQGKLVTAQTVRTYINCGTDVANAFANYVGVGKFFGKPVGNIVKTSNNFTYDLTKTGGTVLPE